MVFFWFFFRQEWKQVWEPQADNSPEDHHLFEELRQKAAEELRQVGPLTDKQVAEALRKMAKKACGPDGLTGPMLKALEPNQVALVADAFRTWEATGVMPETATMSLVALLPKKESEERPIALTSYAYRAGVNPGTRCMMNGPDNISCLRRGTGQLKPFLLGGSSYESAER